MKIYVQDHGWAGVIAVIANSEEDARQMLKGKILYSEHLAFEVFDIKPGVIVENYGDR